jgi:hypothetical protein
LRLLYHHPKDHISLYFDFPMMLPSPFWTGIQTVFVIWTELCMRQGGSFSKRSDLIDPFTPEMNGIYFRRMI